jgi:adenylylsulfate kinase
MAPHVVSCSVPEYGVSFEKDAQYKRAPVGRPIMPYYHEATDSATFPISEATGQLAFPFPRPRGFCIWMTGLPSAGKTTLGGSLARQLTALNHGVEVLDGDEIRRGLSSDLGFDRDSREAHSRRVAFVARLLVRHGAIPVVALISPYASSRAAARQLIGNFVEVYLPTPLEVCEQRDVKGLYRRARRGEIAHLTGVDDPYEPPRNPDIVVDTTRGSPDESASFVLRELGRLGWLPPPIPVTALRGRGAHGP